MKKHKRYIASSLVVTVLVAAIASCVASIFVVFLYSNLGLFDGAEVPIKATTCLVFSGIVGYRLNDLIRKTKKWR